MTSRERVRRTLNRQSTDRIPNGLGGSETSGMHLLAYEKLKGILGIESGGNRMSTFMATSLFEPEVLEAMGGDMILLGTRLSPARFWGKGSAETWKEQMFWGRRFQVAASWQFTDRPDGGIYWEDWDMVCPPGAIYFDEVPSSHADASMNLRGEPVTPDDYCPSPDIPDEKLRALEESARWLYENTDFAIVCGEMPEDFQLSPGGMMNWWMMMAGEHETAHEYLHKACEAGISQFRLLNEAVGKYADVAMIAHDMGDCHGVTVGPTLWREIYKPHYMRLFQSWHQISRMKICLHSCGSIRDILGDLIECGADVINPVQVSATGMEPAKLKKQFGDRVIFYGGAYDAVLNPVDLPAEAVYENVKRNIGIFGEDGGYIFAGVHNIPGNVPDSHIEAILAAYRDSSAYSQP